MVIKKILKSLWREFNYFAYKRLYLPVITVRMRIKHGPLPRDHETAPCQICGEQGHIERFCPKAKDLGF